MRQLSYVLAAGACRWRPLFGHMSPLHQFKAVFFLDFWATRIVPSCRIRCSLASMCSDMSASMGRLQLTRISAVCGLERFFIGAIRGCPSCTFVAIARILASVLLASTSATVWCGSLHVLGYVRVGAQYDDTTKKNVCVYIYICVYISLSIYIYIYIC